MKKKSPLSGLASVRDLFKKNKKIKKNTLESLELFDLMGYIVK